MRCTTRILESANASLRADFDGFFLVFSDFKITKDTELDFTQAFFLENNTLFAKKGVLQQVQKELFPKKLQIGFPESGNKIFGCKNGKDCVLLSENFTRVSGYVWETEHFLIYDSFFVLDYNEDVGFLNGDLQLWVQRSGSRVCPFTV